MRKISARKLRVHGVPTDELPLVLTKWNNPVATVIPFREEHLAMECEGPYFMGRCLLCRYHKPVRSAAMILPSGGRRQVDLCDECFQGAKQEKGVDVQWN